MVAQFTKLTIDRKEFDMSEDVNSMKEAGALEGKIAGQRYLTHALQGTMTEVRALLPERVAVAKRWAQVLITSDDENERKSGEFALAMYAQLEIYFEKANAEER
jgi:hypothetical protein